MQSLNQYITEHIFKNTDVSIIPFIATMSLENNQ